MGVSVSIHLVSHVPLFNRVVIDAVSFFIMQKPTLKPGDIFSSPGGSFRFRVVGAVCLIYDRENLPYPSCNLQWHGKQPSWKRIGRRFVPDMGSMNSESYHVELLDHGSSDRRFLTWTFSYRPMSPTQRDWWYSRRTLAMINESKSA